MKNILAVTVACTFLGACSVSTIQTDLATASAVLQGACTDALAAANSASTVLKGGAANTYSSVVSGVVSGCTTAEGLAALAAEPSSTEWLGIQAGTLNTAVSAASPAT